MKTFDCTDIKAVLSGLVDGELDAASQHLAERHLASCQPCQDLVSQTERLNEMIALDAQSLIAPDALPDGFAASVLSRTVYAEAYHRAGHNVTTWLGWMAAAACLGLASAIWFLDRGGRTPSEPRIAIADQGASSSGASPAGEPGGYAVTSRSWLYDGGLPVREPAQHELAGERDGSLASLDDATIRSIDAALDQMQPLSRPMTPEALADLSSSPAISEDDAQTLHAASMLLRMLAKADLTTFADVDQVRQIAEYDELLPRLEAARKRVPVADRPVVLAAEAVLHRAVNGPVSMDDLRDMHDTVASLDLSNRIGALGSDSAM